MATAKITNHDRRFGPRREEEEKAGEEHENPAMNFGFRVDADDFELKGEFCSGTIWPRSDKLCGWRKSSLCCASLAAHTLTLGVVVLDPLCATILSIF